MGRPHLPGKSRAKPDANWLESLPKNRLIAEFSMWSADLGDLRADLARVEPHVEMLHIDVPDCHFTAALLCFPDQITNLRKTTAKPMHVHLMVQVLSCSARLTSSPRPGPI